MNIKSADKVGYFQINDELMIYVINAMSRKMKVPALEVSEFNNLFGENTLPLSDFLESYRSFKKMKDTPYPLEDGIKELFVFGFDENNFNYEAFAEVEEETNKIYSVLDRTEFYEDDSEKARLDFGVISYCFVYLYENSFELFERLNIGRHSFYPVFKNSIDEVLNQYSLDTHSSPSL